MADLSNNGFFREVRKNCDSLFKSNPANEKHNDTVVNILFMVSHSTYSVRLLDLTITLVKSSVISYYGIDR